jgi:hypothetical protein
MHRENLQSANGDSAWRMRGLEMSFSSACPIILGLLVPTLAGMGLSLGSIGESPVGSPASQKQIWLNPDCAKSPCAVKSASLTNNQILSSSGAMMTMAASFTTSNKSQLKDYAFVQYILGCGFTVDAKGVRMMAHRTNIGVSGVPFQHRNWQLDTGTTVDPIYQSEQPGGDDPLRGLSLPRTGGYYTANPFEDSKAEQWGGLVKNIRTPTLFIADEPTGSSIDTNGIVSISSLKFQTCLYKISDVPPTVENADQRFPNAIHCFDWQSNFTYDAKAGFKSANDLAPFCEVKSP